VKHENALILPTSLGQTAHSGWRCQR